MFPSKHGLFFIILLTFEAMKYAYLIFIIAIASFWSCNENNATAEQSIPAAPELKFDSTLFQLNSKIEADPSNFKNYLDRAEYFAEIANYVDALKDIERAIAIDSTQGEIFLKKGNIHAKMLDEKTAYKDYTQCILLDSKNTDCILKKAYLDIVLKNYPLALSLINDALRINETLPYAYYLKGKLYKETGDTTLACSSYQTAIEVDPGYYEAYIEAGLLFHGRKHELAKEYYRSAIEVRPTSVEPWYNLAMYLQETGYKKNANYKEAFACYDSILKIDPKFAAAPFNKGYIYLEYLQQYDSAAVYFSKAIELYPKYFQAYYNRGLSNESMEKRSEAESDYRMALNIKPDYTEAARSLDRLLKGR